MLTSFQLEAIKAVERIGGGAKVSGAGGGGVIVAFAPDRERLPEIRLSLQDLNYTEVQLTVDTQGITVEAAGKPLRLSAGRGFEPHQQRAAAANSAGQVCTSKTSTLHRATPLRWTRASAVIKGTWRASAKATYWAS